MATETAVADSEKRDKNLTTLSRTLLVVFKSRSEMAKRTSGCGSIFCSFLGSGRFRASGDYLTRCYILMKVLNLMNVIVQFALIDKFLGTNEWFWGGRIVNDFLQGRQWNDTGRFPRVTFCDFDIKTLGNEKYGQRHTIQCVLLINLWNEKIYLFIWFWLIILAVCTALNLISWIQSCYRSSSNKRLIKQYLRVGLPDDFEIKGRKEIFDIFVREGLKSDGVLILRFISSCAGEFITTTIAVNLFKVRGFFINFFKF